jgi:hypothetical protein
MLIRGKTITFFKMRRDFSTYLIKQYHVPCSKLLVKNGRQARKINSPFSFKQGPQKLDFAVIGQAISETEQVDRRELPHYVLFLCTFLNDLHKTPDCLTVNDT